MLSHGFRSFAGRPARSVGRRSRRYGCFRISTFRYAHRAVGLAAAICRTIATRARPTGRGVPRPLAGISWCADAALLTGLLDITGGPFNPFIVIYITYIWLAAVTRFAAVGLARDRPCRWPASRWLVIDHVQAEMVEHHRLNDLPTHLFTMWMRRRRDRRTRRALRLARAMRRSRSGSRILDEARERAAAQRAARVADDPGRRRGARAVDAAGDDRRCVRASWSATPATCRAQLRRRTRCVMMRD